MARIKIGLLVMAVAALCGSALLCNDALAQGCQGGGSRGGGTGGVAMTAAGGGTASSGASLLTGPGSWAYDVMQAQALAQRQAQQRYLAAQLRQAERQQDLAARRARAEQARSQIAAARRSNWGMIAAKNGGSLPPASGSYMAAHRAAR